MADNYDQYSKDELLRLLRERDRKPKFGLLVYSWQPGQIRQRVEAPNVAFERIPEFLTNRFGGMAR
ncbi:MAG: hypothetical protein Q7T38_00520 [Gallionella sp.]|nr:hypothetical protein [Gallionella sp.]